MAVTTITITTDAYKALAAKKAPGESFSEVIKRIARPKQNSLYLLFDVPKDEANRIAKAVEENRKEWDEDHDRQVRKVTEALNAH